MDETDGARECGAGNRECAQRGNTGASEDAGKQMKGFLRDLFSESGTASFSRVGTFIALVGACAWVSRIVWKTGALPGLEGLTFFIASLYGLGKAGETVQRILGKNQ